jgi:hypothetical protein
MIIEQLYGIAQHCIEGGANPADTFAQLRAIEKAVKECLEQVKPHAIKVVKRCGREGYTAHGLQLVVKNAGGRWSYKHIKPHAELTAQLRNIEQLAQTATKTGRYMADNDGVIIEPAIWNKGVVTIYTYEE